MDNVDRLICVMPFLGVLDVVSTLYVESLGYSLSSYEVGFFASLFVSVGLTYFYAIIYVVMFVAIAYFLWFVKNKELTSTRLLDKVFFLLLIGVVCYVYLTLTAVSVGNFLLPYFVAGETSWSRVILVTYLSTVIALCLYLWHDVAAWIKANDQKAKSV